MKARQLDNLEFAQWMKRYFDVNEGTKKAENYDPVMRRFGVEPDFSFVDGAPERPQKPKKDEPIRISKQEEEKETKNGKYVLQKKRSLSNKSPFESKKTHSVSNERKHEKFTAKLKDTVRERFHKDLEEENKYLRHVMKEINDVIGEGQGEKTVNGEEFYKNKLEKIQNLIKSIDEELPGKK